MEKEILKRIYLIRHGETDPNKNQIIQGSGLDAPLNSTGEKQAIDFFRAYHHIPFDAVYTSNLIRTWQSVASFLKENLEHYPMEELNEISWGVKDGTKIDPNEQKIYQALLDDWQAGLLDQSFEKGESPNIVAKRLQKGMIKIMSKPNEKNVLVCSHGRAIRVLLCILMNRPLTEMEQFLHSNMCLYILVWDGKVWKIVVTNDVSHILF